MNNLSKNLKLAVSIFDHVPFNTVSTIDTRRGGIHYPSQIINSLRASVVIISVAKRDTYSEAGELTPNISYYHLE